MKKLEALLEWGGVKRDVTFLVLSGLALLASILFGERAAVDPAWVAILLCGVPIILEASIGLVTAFDIKADVLVSIALVASVVSDVPAAQFPPGHGPRSAPPAARPAA